MSRQAKITGINLDEFELLRKQLQALANKAREVRSELYNTQIPLVEGAHIHEWQSVAKYAYDLALGVISAEATGIAEGCSVIAATYDGLDYVLEVEKGVQFP
ncbi:hypothetical protein [uncultured Gulosibacter sp.]|uniref:hypothetical protein n=1 Tax=uncultured Gulosibacter sp. TaxID=1339167 RepID=UPI00288C3302|nr:hypothetical protein [uncultured Gulosibacter sp.]